MQELFQKLPRIIAILLGACYIGIGLFFVLAPMDILGLDSNLRIMFGVLLFVYGIFRLIRAIKQTPNLVV